MKRVLCFSPYAVWRPHNHWEGTILRALQVNGAQIKLVTCHGLGVCDLERPPDSAPTHFCVQCIAQVALTQNQMDIDYELLGRYAPVDSKQAAVKWASQLLPKDFREAEYEGRPLGEWVRSSIHGRFRVSTLDLEDPDVIKAYRELLLNGAHVSDALNNLFEEYRPEVLFLFNGRMSYPRIALEMAKARGIRAIIHERAETYGSIMLSEDETCLGAAKYRLMWDGWGDIPLTDEELGRTYGWLQDRRCGKNLNWVPFSPAPTPHEDFYRDIGVEPDRPIVALFTSSDDEMAATDDWEEIFDSQLHWINQTVLVFEHLPDHVLVIRVHPNSGQMTGNAKGNQQLLSGIRAVAQAAPPNVHVVWPGDEVSTYTLMDAAQAGLVYGSTAGLETACLGKPVVLARRCWYYGLPLVNSVTSAEQYPEMLLNALNPARPIEIMRSAYRFAYHAYLGMSIHMPLVEMASVVDSRPGWHSIEDLRWGREPGLDRILGCILDDEHVYPGPGPEHVARTTGEEDRFFENLLQLEAVSARA